METSYSVYATIAKTLHLHSPTVVKIDENGIPLNDTGYQQGTYVGMQRNPLTIATQAISYYADYQKSGDANTKKMFINCIDWLEKAKVDKGKYCLWEYDFPLPTYNTLPPWYSAMAQARIMVAFQKAYELTHEEKYLQISEQAMSSLEVEVVDGGVMRKGSPDGMWYEEVAGGGSSASFILNGFIFSLLDLNQYYKETGSSRAKYLFDAGLVELKKHLPEYDTGKWTYYDRIGHFAYDYHYVHIDQMRELFAITKDPVFEEYYRRWASYFPINPLWARERFAAYLFDSAIVFVILTAFIGIYWICYSRIRRKSGHI